MANQAKRRQTQRHYQNNNLDHVNGSAAYQLDYDGSAARVRQPRPEPRPQVRPRRQPAPRPRVEVRPAGTVSLFAVVGFTVVAVFTALLLVASARLMVLNDETVALRSQLKTLQAEESTLLAQRDRAYDLDAIEASLTASGIMVKPQSSQITYLSTDQPDSVVKFEKPSQSFRDVIYEKLREISTTLFS